MSKPTTTRIKIVLEGTSAGVGKTKLWTALSTTGDDAYIYNDLYTPTNSIGFRIAIRAAPTNPLFPFKAIYFDTESQHRFRNLICTYAHVRATDCLLLVYDVSQRETFEGLRFKFDHIITLVQCPVILVGNKVDLREDDTIPLEKFVSWREGHELSMEFGKRMVERGLSLNRHFACLFVEISLKTGRNVAELGRLAEFLALGHTGALDEEALKHCVALEWPHVCLERDGVLELTPQTWSRACRVQKEIALMFAAMRHGRRNSLHSTLPTFLRRHIVTFLPVCEREKTWYSDNMWQKHRTVWSGRTRNLAEMEDLRVSESKTTPRAKSEEPEVGIGSGRVSCVVS